MTIEVTIKGHLGDDTQTTVVVQASGEAAIRCGIDFNPTGNTETAVMKALFAAVTQRVLAQKGRNSSPIATAAVRNALDDLWKAQMMAVKALFIPAPKPAKSEFETIVPER